ncbi:MAG: DUF1853 family protein [Verrucomicrobiaceae bacterium]
MTLLILNSLIHSSPLITHLPEASSFPHHSLSLPTEPPDLNLQQKLGHLYEDALALLLNASPRFDLLAQNLQIQKDAHTTLGELDFLLRDTSTGQLIHLELATKFYLAVDDELPGPDARDNYFKKLSRLRTHQLTLAQKHRDHLPPEFRDEPIITQQLIHGCLFDHLSAPTPATPELLNPTCRRGKWLTIDQLPHHFPPDTTYHLIPKPLWPVPLDLLTDTPLDPWSPPEKIDRCLMVRASHHQEPYFITPSNYPNQENS